MPSFDRIGQIIELAISREQSAYHIYMDLSKKAKNKGSEELAATLREMAQEELAHRARLEAVLTGKVELMRQNVEPLGLSETLEEPVLEKEFSVRDIIAFAIKKEDVSVMQYKRLANGLDWGGLREFFLALAEEEAEHLLKFEQTYENIS